MAESRPRPELRPEILVTPQTHQRVTDGLVKRFASDEERAAAYLPAQTDLNAPATAVPPPYEGEPTEVWDGSDWEGITIWQGHAWKPLRQPLPGQEGLVVVEVDDAEAVGIEPAVGDERQYLRFTATLIGQPRGKVAVEYLSEERDPRSLADRGRRNPDGTDAVPNPDPGGASLGVDFEAVHGTLVFDPADRANDDFGADPITLADGRTAYLSNPSLLQVEIFPDIESGEGAERLQMRLQNPTRCRIDRPIGIGVIASSQQPVVRIYDTSVETEHASPVAGQPRQIRPTTAYFRVEVVKNAAAATKPITFTARTRDISATAGTDYIALDGSITYTIPVGTTAITIPVTIPAQPTEGFERFGITLGNLSSEAVFATQYAECEIRGTPANPLFLMEQAHYGALFGEPEPSTIDIPWYVIPAPTATTVVDYWTQVVPNFPGTAQDYERISESNRRQIAISPGQSSGTIRLGIYLFRNRARDIRNNPSTARPEREVAFNIVARRRSGAELDGIDNDPSGDGNGRAIISLGVAAYAGSTEDYTISIGAGRPRTGTETEGDQPSENIQARFPITIDKSPDTPISVTASTATGGNFGTAESGVDFVAKTQTIQWGTGDTELTKYYDVDIIEETLAEPDEYFSAVIRNPVPANRATITTPRATYTIAGEGTQPGQPTPPPGVSISSAEIQRPATGTLRQLSFPVSITRAPTSPASVDVVVAPASATANQHYQTTANTAAGFPGTATTINWAANDGENKVVNVLILGGDNLDGPVFFVVRLSNPSGVSLLQPEARGAILVRPEADTPSRPTPTRRLPAVGIDNSTRPEDDTTGYLRFFVDLNRAVASGQTGRVDYITQGLGTCRPGEDYDLHSQLAGTTQRRTTSRELAGQVSFTGAATRREVRVAVINDDRVEPNERFQVRLSSPVNCEIDPSRSVGIGTIESEDQPPTVRARPAVSVSRPRLIGNQMVFSIRLSAAAATAVTGLFGTRNGTAIAGQEYIQEADRRWVIPAGTTAITIPVRLLEPIGDTEQETFTGSISDISNNATLTGRDATATATIPARQTPDPTSPDPTSILGLEIVSQPARRGDNAVVAVTRTGNYTHPVAVRLVVASGTATVSGRTIPTSDSPAADIFPFARIVSLGRGIVRSEHNIPTRVPTTSQPAETAYAIIHQQTGTGATLGPNWRVPINLPAYAPFVPPGG